MFPHDMRMSPQNVNITGYVDVTTKQADASMRQVIASTRHDCVREES